MTKSTTPTLVHKSTGKPVQIGEEVTDFRGDKAIVTGWDTPHSPASTGRLYVVEQDRAPFGFYPSVFDCEWIGRTDR